MCLVWIIHFKMDLIKVKIIHAKMARVAKKLNYKGHLKEFGTLIPEKVTQKTHCLQIFKGLSEWETNSTPAIFMVRLRNLFQVVKGLW